MANSVMSATRLSFSPRTTSFVLPQFKFSFSHPIAFHYLRFIPLPTIRQFSYFPRFFSLNTRPAWKLNFHPPTKEIFKKQNLVLRGVFVQSKLKRNWQPNWIQSRTFSTEENAKTRGFEEDLNKRSIFSLDFSNIFKGGKMGIE